MDIKQISPISFNPRPLLFSHKMPIITQNYDRHNGYADRELLLHTMPDRELK
jgi:hypothetical protein